MLNDFIQVARRSPSALVKDLLGAAALVVLFLGSLYLPVLT